MNEPSEYRDNVVPLTSLLSDRSGGGGLLPPSGGGGIEARLARVESDIAHVQRDLSEIKVDQKAILASLHRLEELSGRFDERLKVLPSKGFIVSAVVIALTVLAGVITFGGQIRSLVSPEIRLSPQAAS